MKTKTVRYEINQYRYGKMTGNTNSNSVCTFASMLFVYYSLCNTGLGETLEDMKDFLKEANADYNIMKSKNNGNEHFSSEEVYYGLEKFQKNLEMVTYDDIIFPSQSTYHPTFIYMGKKSHKYLESIILDMGRHGHPLGAVLTWMNISIAILVEKNNSNIINTHGADTDDNKNTEIEYVKTDNLTKLICNKHFQVNESKIDLEQYYQFDIYVFRCLQKSEPIPKPEPKPVPKLEPKPEPKTLPQYLSQYKKTIVDPYTFLFTVPRRIDQNIMNLDEFRKLYNYDRLDADAQRLIDIEYCFYPK